jgi:hypothetical protein
MLVMNYAYVFTVVQKCNKMLMIYSIRYSIDCMKRINC